MIDPSIPLQIQPPKIDDPLAAYGKVLNIQTAQQQQQMGAQKIQSNAMELRQQQRALDYQNVFTQSLQKHTTQNPDGSLATDWGGVQGDVTNAGFGPEAVKMNADIMKAKEAGLDLLHKQNQADLDRTQAVSRTVGSLPKVDTTAPPDVQAQQKAAWGAAALTGITNLVKSGHMPQQQGAALASQIQQTGWTPELQAQAEQLQMQGLTAEQQIQHVQNGINQAREAKTAEATVSHLNAETQGLQQTQADKGRSDLAVLLSKAKTPAEYDAILAKNPAQAAGLPRSSSLHFTKNGLTEDSAENVVTSGMNATQLDQHNTRKDAESLRKLSTESLIESRKATEAFRQDSLDLRRSMLEGQPKPAQKADAARLDFNQKALAPLSKQAGLLATALADGKPEHVLANGMFVDDKGNQVEISKKLGTDNPTPRQVKALIDQMKADLNATKTRMIGITNASHDIMERWGGTPSVSREDSLASINRIGSGATGTDKTGPPTTAANPPSEKPASTPPQSAVAETSKAVPAPPQAIPNFRADLAAQMAVGTPRQLKLSNGSTITVVKKADGKVYQQ